MPTGPVTTHPPLPIFNQQDRLNCEKALRELSDAAAILPKCVACGLNVDDVQKEISDRTQMIQSIIQQFMGHL